MTLLELKNVSVAYGRIEAIHDMSFSVEEGEIVSLIGANGAGKSTTMKTISGILNPSQGSILFDGQDITKMKAHIRVIRGISQAPEGRGIFPGMTVLENLDMGAFGRKDRSTWARTSTACSRCSRVSPSARPRSAARCPEASSRCSPSGAR